MKTLAWAVGGLVFLLAGCAHQKAQFAGHEFKPLGAQEDLIWSGGRGTGGAWIKNVAAIRAIRGTAQISGNRKHWQKARVGTKLGAGASVQSDPDSIVDIFLGENGPVLRLRENTAVHFERLDLCNTGVEKLIDTRIELQKGQILGSVKKLAAGSSYLIRTPTSLLQIRGTEFSVTADDTVRVVSGSVEVFREGKRTGVTSGQKYTPTMGIQPMSTTDIQMVHGETASSLNLGPPEPPPIPFCGGITPFDLSHPKRLDAF